MLGVLSRVLREALQLKPPGLHVPPGSSCVGWDTFPFYGFIFTPESDVFSARTAEPFSGLSKPEGSGSPRLPHCDVLWYY